MEPIRTCVGCRQRDSAKSMIRVVLVSGAPVIDWRARLPGRGAWIHRACVDLAVGRGGLKRALRSSSNFDELRVFIAKAENDAGSTMSYSK